MGACASCLGLGNSRSEYRDDEDSRLLDDPNSMNYGGFVDQASNSIQGDPQDVQKENEALQKVVAHTSNNLIDIFAMIPQAGHRSSPYSGQDARLAHYHEIVATLPSTRPESQSPQNGETDTGADWFSDEEEDEDFEPVGIVKPLEPILGSFGTTHPKVK